MKTHDSSGAISAGEPLESRAARDTADQLAAGHEVAAAEVARAYEALLEQMSRDRVCSADTVMAESLRTLQRGTSLENRGRLLGSLLALGPAGIDGLSAALDPAREDLFPGCWTARERTELIELATRPARERLKCLAERLQATAKRDSDPNPPENAAPSPSGPAPLFPMLAVAGLVGRLKETPDDPDSRTLDDGEPDLEAILLDRATSEERRFSAAQELGSRALPILRSLAAVSTEREITIASLVSLGREKAHAREVNALAVRMQIDPRTSDVGDAILDALDDAPRRVRQSPDAVETSGWLQRSLDACSAPAIMAASAGREMAVLPHLTGRIVNLRLTKKSETSQEATCKSARR